MYIYIYIYIFIYLYLYVHVYACKTEAQEESKNNNSTEKKEVVSEKVGGKKASEDLLLKMTPHPLPLIKDINIIIIYIDFDTYSEFIIDCTGVGGSRWV